MSQYDLGKMLGMRRPAISSMLKTRGWGNRGLSTACVARLAWALGYELRFRFVKLGQLSDDVKLLSRGVSGEKETFPTKQENDDPLGP